MWGGRGTLDTVNSIGLSRKHLIEGMHASLERMQLSYVDLVFCHRPDSRTPIWETVRAMNYLIDQGERWLTVHCYSVVPSVKFIAAGSQPWHGALSAE